jgi:hypothetical protein
MKTALVAIPALAMCLPILRADEAQLKTESESKTACHGTAVEFVSNPVAAAKLAKDQKKLVLILHVSGNFEDPAFT